MQDIYNRLYSYMELMQIINTHSHHLEDSVFSGLDLDELLKRSYISWCGFSFDNSPASRSAYLDKVRYNSYFIWLEKALQKMYDFHEPLNSANWDSISEKVLAANRRENSHLDNLTSLCRYEKIILDAIWDPGSSNGHPDVFMPAFRINSFLFGYSRSAFDHNGFNPVETYHMEVRDIDEYVMLMEDIIINKKNSGCVALKSALAYDRTLDFEKTTKEKAQMAFNMAMNAVDPGIAKAFGDYIFYEICRIAAENDLPLQCHVGLGLGKMTNAMRMQEIIENNPDTKFILFHGGYPWLDDVCALTHLYRNVYPDICWLPLISTSAAERLLEELIEIGTIDKICWGCDTSTSEESFGALLAVRHVLANVLTKKIKEGYLTINDAEIIIQNILYKNPKNIYGI